MQNNPEYLQEKESFNAYYETTVLPELQKIEARRKKYLLRFILIGLFIIFWCISLMSDGALLKENISGDVAGVVFCFSILALCWPLLSYYKKSKESLLPVLAGYFGQFSYACRAPLNETLLKQSKIMKKYDVLDTDDSFSGQYDGVGVNFAEYILRDLKYEKKDGVKRPVYIKKACGIIFIAQMNKNFSSQTIVVKDKGWLNKFAHYKNLQKAGLESPEFEKQFEVYTDNQIEARYLLTVVMLNYMLEVKKAFPNVEFSFFDKNVFINIELKKNLFEISSFFTSIINKKRIKKSFYELYLLFSIIKILRLDKKTLF